MRTENAENWWVFPGFEIEVMAAGLDLPVNIAFVAKPGDKPGDPLFYVTELYGQVKAITNDLTVHTYASNLLNYKIEDPFPQGGQVGVTGICVEPATGDLFVSMVYQEEGEYKNRLIRASSKTGLKMEAMTTIIENIPSTDRAHQVQLPSIGFDGKLYLNVADGNNPDAAQDDQDLRGKILRLNLDGSIPADNPSAGSPVYAKGFRNPFGAAWRKSDRALYSAINGPDQDDVIARIDPGSNHGWPATMRQDYLFRWHHTQASTALGFMQDGQFPPEFDDELFVALFGYFGYYKGRKIVKLRLNDTGPGVISYDEFVVYKGPGFATPCGLAFWSRRTLFHRSGGRPGRPQPARRRRGLSRQMGRGAIRAVISATAKRPRLGL